MRTLLLAAAWCWRADSTTTSEPHPVVVISGAERLRNGNTLICSGGEFRIFEVSKDGEVVWDLRFPDAARVPADHPALAGRTLAPIDIE